QRLDRSPSSSTLIRLLPWGVACPRFNIALQLGETSPANKSIGSQRSCKCPCNRRENLRPDFGCHGSSISSSRIVPICWALAPASEWDSRWRRLSAFTGASAAHYKNSLQALNRDIVECHYDWHRDS